MSYTAETISKGGFKLEIISDDDPMNPRTEFDNLSKMVCFHSRYKLGDEQDDYNQDDYDSWSELEATIVKKEKPLAILPLYLYDHSGLTVKTSPFGCRWDSGQIGFVYVPRKNMDGLKNNAEDKATAFKVMEGEVETYDQFLRGDVYGYVVTDESGEEVDSCWGFFGEKYALEEGTAVLEHAVEKASAERLLVES